MPALCGFQSSETWHCVAGWVAADVSKYRVTSNFKKEWNVFLQHNTTNFRNVLNRSPNDKRYWSAANPFGLQEPSSHRWVAGVLSFVKKTLTRLEWHRIYYGRHVLVRPMCCLRLHGHRARRKQQVPRRRWHPRRQISSHSIHISATEPTHAARWKRSKTENSTT